MGVPLHFNRIFHCKPSIWGYHHLWNPAILPPCNICYYILLPVLPDWNFILLEFIHCHATSTCKPPQATAPQGRSCGSGAIRVSTSISCVKAAVASCLLTSSCSIPDTESPGDLPFAWIGPDVPQEQKKEVKSLASQTLKFQQWWLVLFLHPFSTSKSSDLPSEDPQPLELYDRLW